MDVPTIDLAADVVYLPVRHHSPACAFHVDAVIRTVKPDLVLIEGPRDATALLPLLADEQTRLPVAIYTTYVEKCDAFPEGVDRHAAYYPLCAYSPELVAVRSALDVGAEPRLIDLTYPEMVQAGRRRSDAKPQNLQSDRHLRRGVYLRLACEQAGARDADDLWDGLFESDHQRQTPETFFRSVLAYCTAIRHGADDAELEADGTLPRERAMAAATHEHRGKRIVVVTGGFHTVALPTTSPAMPEPVTVAPDDAVVVLMRYGFEQLDALNGYAAGMPSPGFYQHLWDGGEPVELLVELGRRCRRQERGISIADEIAASQHVRRLAALRGHATPTREDVLDGVRSCFVKGEADAEGMAVLALARQMLAGDTIGSVPDAAGQPPIVHDFHAVAARLKIDTAKPRGGETHLDLYRRAAHRAVSRFFHQLGFLDVPFAQWVSGPDFVAGEDLARVQERWTYAWSPGTESALIERSLYGASVEQAAAGKLGEVFTDAERSTDQGKAATAAALVLTSCRMGLHRHTPALLERTARLIGAEADFAALVAATERLLMLHVAVEPLEAFDLPGVTELADTAYRRACYLLPELAATAEPQEEAVIDALSALTHAARTLGDDADRRTARLDGLQRVIDEPNANPAVRGAALGLLHAEGVADDDELARAFAGHLGAANDAGPAFLRGLLRTARATIWQVPALLDALHRQLHDADNDVFIRQLPQLRLAFADMTPAETDRLAKRVAEHAGAEPDALRVNPNVTADDALLGSRLDKLVTQSLERDGLGGWEVSRGT